MSLSLLSPSLFNGKALDLHLDLGLDLDLHLDPCPDLGEAQT